MAVGAGYYFGAAATTIIVIAALYLLREVRNRLLPRLRTDFGVLNVTFAGAGSEINEVVGTLERHSVQIRSLGAEIEGGLATYTIQLRIPPRRSMQGALEEISALSGVERVSVSGLREVE